MTLGEKILNNKESLHLFEDCQTLEEVQDRLYEIKLDLSDTEFEEILLSVANLAFTI